MPDEAKQIAIRDITAALEVGALRHNIAQCFSLTEVAAAHDAQDSGKMIGKAIIEISLTFSNQIITRKQPIMLLTTVAKRFHAFSLYAAIKHLLMLFLMLGCIISLPIPTQAAELSALSPALHTAEKFSPIQNTEQAILYLNAQNLVDTWNNIIIQAKTGDEQLKLMRESGVFADDVKLTFEFNDRQIVMNGLDSPEAHQFYNSFVNGLKKQRYNIASNVEAVEFGKDSLRFNFKHWIFFNERLSLVGENQVVMQRAGNHPQIKMADVRVVYFDIDHAY